MRVCMCARERVRVGGKVCARAGAAACAGVGFLGVSVCVGSNRPVGCVKGEMER